TPFKELRVSHWLRRGNLRQPTTEPLEVRGLLERPIHPRGADLQDVAGPGNQFFHVQNHAELLADPLAIRVADLWKRVVHHLAGPKCPAGIANHRRRLRHAVDVHAQEPLLADFPFDINDFQAFRTRHALGGRADFLQIHCRDSTTVAGSHCTPPGPNKKVGSRPLNRSTRFRAKLQYIPPLNQKQDTLLPNPVSAKVANSSSIPAGFSILERGRTCLYLSLWKPRD